jgi:mannose/cellobiose epimerase-like protein (N-acyl-D-glucosamine 2-epimerase family)
MRLTSPLPALLDLPDFRAPAFLRSHALHILAFYEPRCIDASGGFFQGYADDGRVVDADTRHLIGSARFVSAFARAARRFPDHAHAPAWRDAVRHGLRFLDEVHREGDDGYAWLLNWRAGRRTVIDPDARCHGLACVLQAQAHALALGLCGAPALAQTYALMERRFWEPAHRLYADEATPDGQLTRYRGQKANMFACEALIDAFEASGEAAYLERAAEVAHAVTQRLASPQPGLVWEHHHADWTPDLDYRARDGRNLSRPRGYQTGHHAQWARLLLTLERLQPGLADNPQRVHRARELFAAAVEHGWDRAHEGLAYSFMADEAPGHDGRYVLCDADKYFWVQAEAIAAAALLAERTIEGGYWDWYDRLWAYVWQHFVDHRHGAWYRILGPDNRRLSDEKSPPGKTDYQPMVACYEALESLTRA